MENNISTEKKEKISLKTYFKDLRNKANDFKTQIKEACGVSDITVDRWVYGLTTPPKLAQEKIAEIIGVSADELFSEDQTCK